jgi:membrane associated rhomboid family serine protease
MGIYDRDYYRGDDRSFLGGLVERGAVCKWLIGINVVVFILQLATRTAHSLSGPVTDALILDTAKVLDGQVWRLITYSFLHATDTPWHILFNMLFLAWFGRDVEDLYGPREFLTFYLVAALLGGLVFLLAAVFGGPSLCLGASGAVTAVMVVFACHYPSRVILLFFVLPVPIWAFVVFMVVKDLFGFVSGQPGGVAVSVHLAGALFGYLYYRRQWRLLNWLPNVRDWWKRRQSPRLRLFRPESDDDRPPPVGVGAVAHLDDEQLEAKVDAVLAKLKQVGSRDKLTEGERQVLLRASEVFRNKRRG